MYNEQYDVVFNGIWDMGKIGKKLTFTDKITGSTFVSDPDVSNFIKKFQSLKEKFHGK